MNLVEISNKFPTELDCIKYFEKVRWNNSIVCAYCSSDNIGERNKDHRFHCKTCKKSFSVTTGTKLHNTRLTLKTWLISFGVISDAKKGISAKQLERNLGVHYETAWTMYHKIRELMIEDVKLEGIVEADETFIGGVPRYNLPKGVKEHKKMPKLDEKIEEYKNEFKFKKGKYKKPFREEPAKRGRGTEKTAVSGLVQRNGDVIAQVMNKTSFTEIKKLVKKYIDMPDSVLLTDEFKAYTRFDAIMKHVAIDHNKTYSYRGLNTNMIESFWEIVKRGIHGQYHHVSDKYLQKYLDEFCFKFNNRKKDDMFETLIKNSMLPLNKAIKRNTKKMVEENEKYLADLKANKK
ncbi:MAG: IS1595 family transposase [Bacteroidales bacterium]|nr:IS1595 family transposase [Bacteroidales bacterium]